MYKQIQLYLFELQICEVDLTNLPFILNLLHATLLLPLNFLLMGHLSLL
jgi:hypothetical protein